MAFQYKPRSEKSVDKRASQSGNDFEGIFLDDVEVYTVRKGDNSVRMICPTWEEDHDYGFPIPEHYGIDVYVHYQVGPTKASVLCLSHMKKKACPICEAATRALSSGDEDLSKELKAGKGVVAYILDRKEPEKGLQVWRMPWTVDRDISKLMKDKDTGEIYLIDDPDEGYDVYFEKEGEKLQTKYTGIALARKTSKVPKAILQEAIDRPLPEVLRWRSYAEIKALFEGGESDEPSAKKLGKKPPVEEDDDPPPRSKRRQVEEEDEPPKRKPMGRPRDSVDDDEIPEEWPVRAKKKPPVEEEDDPAPRKKRQTIEESQEEDEPAPPRKKRPPVEEEEDEPAPRRKPRAVVEEEDEPPRKKRPPVEEEEDEPQPSRLRDRMAARRGER